MKRTYVLKALLLFLALIVFHASSSEYDDNPDNPESDDAHDYGISVSGSGKTLWGKGYSKCEDGLPTLSIAKENIINTKAEWDAVVKKNPFFIVSASDSKCELCCRAEPILRDLTPSLLGRHMLSYPEKNKKTKKIVRREIKIFRVDLANKKLVGSLTGEGSFIMGEQISIVRDGRLYKYDGDWGDVDVLI